MKFRTAYDGLSSEVSIDTSIDFLHEVSRTQQHQKDDADINNILKRFRVTGVLKQGVRVPTFGDFDSVVDFRGAMDAILSAEKSFSAMSSDVRARFQNDPQQFLEFCSDEANLPEMRKLGLAVPLPAKGEPLEVRVIPDPIPEKD